MEKHHICVICDTFPPKNTSGAIQLKYLVDEFASRNYFVTVITPDTSINFPFQIDVGYNHSIIRVKWYGLKSKIKNIRAASEIIFPLYMCICFFFIPKKLRKHQSVIWYSPSIFFSPFIRFLLFKNRSSTYLILRDIFPDWAVDLGLLKKGFAYKIFKLFEYDQYKVADKVGVQSESNLIYFQNSFPKLANKIEVLNNWLGQPKINTCPISLSKDYGLEGKIIFLYSGNMGIAQGMENIIRLAQKMKENNNVAFVFIGRGSELNSLLKTKKKFSLDNVIFLDEMSSDNIFDLYRQCHVGLVSLDMRHNSHNIPGKFLSYLQAGIPVLANVNKGNDLVDFIEKNQVGEVCDSSDLEELHFKAERLIKNVSFNPKFYSHCNAVFLEHFFVFNCANQIERALGLKKN